MKGIKKLDTSTKTPRPRIYAEVTEPQPVAIPESDAKVYTGKLREIRTAVLDMYHEWRYIPDSKFARELFAILYVTPVKGIAPSKRKREAYRLFRKSLEIMWYQTQNAQALAQAS
jgi:hypothetical protein